jgi:hypothetical protein
LTITHHPLITTPTILPRVAATLAFFRQAG